MKSPTEPAATSCPRSEVRVAAGLAFAPALTASKVIAHDPSKADTNENENKGKDNKNTDDDD
jgi:hypothetical protein